MLPVAPTTLFPNMSLNITPPPLHAVTSLPILWTGWSTCRPGQIGESVSQGAAGRTVAATRMRAINTATGVSVFDSDSSSRTPAFSVGTGSPVLSPPEGSSPPLCTSFCSATFNLHVCRPKKSAKRSTTAVEFSWKWHSLLVL